MSNWGIRYVVIAVGSKEMPATEADLDVVVETLDEKPFNVTKLSDKASDWLTLALLREQGVL